MNFFEELKKYFETTPKDVIKKHWEETEKLDNIKTPTVDIGLNTILHTKDGRKIGNAIVTKVHSPGRFEIITDYGNKIQDINLKELEESFYIAWKDCTKEIDGYDCKEMQEMFQVDHKHRRNE